MLNKGAEFERKYSKLRHTQFKPPRINQDVPVNPALKEPGEEIDVLDTVTESMTKRR